MCLSDKSSVTYGSTASSSNVTAYCNPAAQLAGSAVNGTNEIGRAAPPILYVTAAMVEGVTLVGGSHSS